MLYTERASLIDPRINTAIRHSAEKRRRMLFRDLKRFPGDFPDTRVTLFGNAAFIHDPLARGLARFVLGCGLHFSVQQALLLLQCVKHGFLELVDTAMRGLLANGDMRHAA